MDCDCLDNGCFGGTFIKSFTYVKLNGEGVDTEESYPYRRTEVREKKTIVVYF